MPYAVSCDAVISGLRRDGVHGAGIQEIPVPEATGLTRDVLVPQLPSAVYLPSIDEEGDEDDDDSDLGFTFDGFECEAMESFAEPPELHASRFEVADLVAASSLQDFCDDPVPIFVVEGVAHAVVAGSAVAIAGVARQRMLDAHATGEYFGKQLVNIQHLVSRVHKAASGDFREKAQLIADISNNVGAECVAVVRNFQEWQGPEFSDILRVRGNWCLAVQLGLVLAGAALELVAAFGEDVVTVQRNGYSDVGLILYKLKQAIIEDWLDEDIKEWLLEFFGRRGLETSIVLSARACVCTGIDRQCSLCGSDCVV